MPMHPFFMAHGPAFRAGVEVEPFDNIDLFPLILHLSGIPIPPNNGTLLRTHGLLFRRGFSLGMHVGWAVGKNMNLVQELRSSLLSCISVHFSFANLNYLSGFAVILGLLILFGILSFIVRRRRNRNRRHIPLLESRIAYRYSASGDSMSSVKPPELILK